MSLRRTMQKAGVLHRLTYLSSELVNLQQSMAELFEQTWLVLHRPGREPPSDWSCLARDQTLTPDLNLSPSASACAIPLLRGPVHPWMLCTYCLYLSALQGSTSLCNATSHLCVHGGAEKERERGS